MHQLQSNLDCDINDFVDSIARACCSLAHQAIQREAENLNPTIREEEND